MKLVKNIKKMVLQQKLFLYKGAYIKYVGGGGGGGGGEVEGFTNF